MASHPAESTADDIECDLLIFYATSSEETELKSAAKRMGLAFDRKRRQILGEYYVVGKVGDFRVVAVQTKMGPLGFEGSAAKSIYFKIASGATAVVQLGMAFGIDPARQKVGDVIVSSSIIPYERRNILGDGNGYRIDYSPALRQQARPSMVSLFQRESTRAGLPYQVHVGAVLSGGAAISSRKFRDELIAGIPPTDEPIVGGEMEGVGLVAVSPPDDPAWIVVKGISDFAEDDRAAVIKLNRPVACRNSAEFVLSALLTAKQL